MRPNRGNRSPAFLAVWAGTALISLLWTLSAHAEDVRYQRDRNGRVTAAWIKKGAPFGAIRTALDTLAAYDGGKLYIAAGTYEVTGPPLSIPSRTNVIGRKSRGQLPELLIPSDGPNRVLDVQGASDVTISRISFDSNYANRTPGVNVYGVRIAGVVDGLSIKDCEFANATHAIRIEKSATVNGLTILSNSIRVQDVQPGCADHVATGIFVHPASATVGALIRGNVITGDAGSPDGLGGGAAIYFGGDQSTLSENFIHDYSAGAGRPNGVSKGGIGILLVGGADHNVVEGNTFENVHGDNLSIRGAHIEVTNNEIRGSRDQGIAVQDALDVSVFGNRVFGCETTALRILNSTDVRAYQNELRDAATDPTIAQSLQAGIALVNNASANPGETIADVLLSENIIGSVVPLKYGINIGSSAADDNATTGVAVENNVFDGQFETEIHWPTSATVAGLKEELVSEGERAGMSERGDAALEYSGPFTLRAVAPNPLRERGTISFALPRQARVKVEVFDVRGRRIQTLVDGEYPSGVHSRTWRVRDEIGRRVQPGVYFVRAQSGVVSLSQKMIVVK